LVQPRKKTSTKRTSIPNELLEQIEDLILSNFRDQLKRRIPVVSGSIFPEEIVLGVGLQVPKQLKNPRFDVSVDYNPKKDNAQKMIHLCVDVLGGLFEKLVLEEADEDFPRIWESFEFENRKVYIQYGTTNLNLEAEADALLGLDNEDLMKFDDEDEALESADSIKSRLGFSDDDEDPEDSETH
tara:strand:- start:85062 stop:85613 length:552 start_codon:yes stop_codon:yes gene_type:complete